MAKKKPTTLIPAELIDRSILLIRGQKVLLDIDLAQLYGVETSALVQAVNRNRSGKSRSPRMICGMNIASIPTFWPRSIRKLLF
jgi:hypothetical protein